MLPNEGKGPDAKLANVLSWFKQGTRVDAEDNKGNSTTGVIEVEPKRSSGIWGYEGDSIAVQINGSDWPSYKVRPSVVPNL